VTIHLPGWPTTPTRTGAAAGHDGYLHEAVCYDSDEHLLAVTVPFLLGGVAAGEPTVVALGERASALVRDALPDPGAVTFLTGGEMYARPAGAIRAYRKMLARYTGEGAGQIRIIGELGPAVTGPVWDSWARYESAINHAYDEFPLWGMCAYDVRVTPAAVLDDVARTHPRTALPGDRHVPSPAFVDPAVFLADRRPVPPDPVQHGTPLIDLIDPTPMAARRAVRDHAHAGLSPADREDLLVAVSEIVTNARRHGRGPVLLRLWAGADRTVVTVTDQGDGPGNPYAGLLPAHSGSPITANGGLGLWITHQACDHVTMGRAPDGFTVRLTAGVAGRPPGTP
jgi:anti-sigma regulatory factor (Ser/Thr protein kinase)